MDVDCVLSIRNWLDYGRFFYKKYLMLTKAVFIWSKTKVLKQYNCEISLQFQ